MPAVLHQGRLGTCTVHAAVNAYRFALRKEARQATAFMPSRLFIFYNVKQKLLNEQGPVDYASGASSRAAFLSIQLFGACDESLFPYPPYGHEDSVRRRPPIPNQGAPQYPYCFSFRFVPCSHQLNARAACFQDATRHKQQKLLTAIKLFPNNLVDPYFKLYTLMSALSRGHPIACGIKYVEFLLLICCKVVARCKRFDDLAG